MKDSSDHDLDAVEDEDPKTPLLTELQEHSFNRSKFENVFKFNTSSWSIKRSDHELDSVDDEDPKTPLLTEVQEHSFNRSSFENVLKLNISSRSILKTSTHDVNIKPGHNFLTVPGQTNIYPPQVSPNHPRNSTLLANQSIKEPIGTSTHSFLPNSQSKVSFVQQEFNSPAPSRRSVCPPHDTTKYKRSQYLSRLLLIFTEGLLPLFSILISLYNVLELFMQGEAVLGWVGVVIFCFPTVLILFYYTENMFHRENKPTEMGLILVLGPFLRWLCSARLLTDKLGGNTSPDMTDLQNFSLAIKMIDGIFQACVQIMWLLYLIAIDIYPFPVLNLRTKLVTDWFGNQLALPILSSYGLYTSLAVLVKNLSQLWRINYPAATDQDGSETILGQPQCERKWRTIYQWILLIFFAASSIIYRLVSYTLLFLHFNLFMMPAGAIIVLSAFLHVILRGLSNRFYVETSKMDVFLTACCCSLVPTPTSSNIRAHNLLQTHTVITNILIFLSLGLAIFFNLDYGVPIVRRPDRLGYSSRTFFAYCLVAICLLPLSYIFYYLYKKEMGHPDTVRKTIFWRNKTPTALTIIIGFICVTIMAILILLICLGSYSSLQCDPKDLYIDHGMIVYSTEGAVVECHSNYLPQPSGKIFCMWFFGQHGFLQLYPLYFNRNAVLQSMPEPTPNHSFFGSNANLISLNHVTFMRSLEGLNCHRKNESKVKDCSISSDQICHLEQLNRKAVPNGVWRCIGITCFLTCNPGFATSGGTTIICDSRHQIPHDECSITSLAAVNSSHMEFISENGDCLMLHEDPREESSVFNKVVDYIQPDSLVFTPEPHEELEQTLIDYDYDYDFDKNKGSVDTTLSSISSTSRLSFTVPRALRSTDNTGPFNMLPEMPLVLCKELGEFLFSDSHCFVLNEKDEKISFLKYHHLQKPELKLVNYQRLPPKLLDQVEDFGSNLTNGQLNMRGNCVVQLNHKSLMITGEQVIIVSFNGTELTFMALPSLLIPRHFHSCTLLDQGKVLVTGGRSLWRGSWITESEILSLDSFWKGWMSVGHLKSVRTEGKILKVDGGCVMLVGGYGESGESISSMEEFHSHPRGNGGVWMEPGLSSTMPSVESWSTALCSRSSIDQCGQTEQLTDNRRTQELRDGEMKIDIGDVETDYSTEMMHVFNVSKKSGDTFGVNKKAALGKLDSNFSISASNEKRSNTSNSVFTKPPGEGYFKSSSSPPDNGVFTSDSHEELEQTFLFTTSTSLHPPKESSVFNKEIDYVYNYDFDKIKGSVGTTLSATSSTSRRNSTMPRTLRSTEVTMSNIGDITTTSSKDSFVLTPEPHEELQQTLTPLTISDPQKKISLINKEIEYDYDFDFDTIKGSLDTTMSPTINTSRQSLTVPRTLGSTVITPSNIVTIRTTSTPHTFVFSSDPHEEPILFTRSSTEPQIQEKKSISHTTFPSSITGITRVTSAYSFSPKSQRSSVVTTLFPLKSSNRQSSTLSPSSSTSGRSSNVPRKFQSTEVERSNTYLKTTTSPSGSFVFTTEPYEELQRTFIFTRSTTSDPPKESYVFSKEIDYNYDYVMLPRTLRSLDVTLSKADVMTTSPSHISLFSPDPNEELFVSSRSTSSEPFAESSNFDKEPDYYDYDFDSNTDDTLIDTDVITTTSLLRSFTFSPDPPVELEQLFVLNTSTTSGPLKESFMFTKKTDYYDYEFNTNKDYVDSEFGGSLMRVTREKDELKDKVAYTDVTEVTDINLNIFESQHEYKK